MRTQADLDLFVVRQEGELRTCEAKRSGLVALIDQAQTKPKRKWLFKRPDS